MQESRLNHPNITFYPHRESDVAKAVAEASDYPPFTLILPTTVVEGWKYLRPRIDMLVDRNPCLGGAMRVTRALTRLRKYCLWGNDDLFLPRRIVDEDSRECTAITFLAPGLLIEQPERIQRMDGLGPGHSTVISHFTAAVLQPDHGTRCDYRVG